MNRLLGGTEMIYYLNKMWLWITVLWQHSPNTSEFYYKISNILAICIKDDKLLAVLSTIKY